jgi:hypothetical protein
MIAGRATAEHQKLNEPQPQGVDAHDYVPGVNPTEAHMVQTARASRNEKLVASEMPDGFKANAAANNEARINYYDDLAGTRTLAKRLVDDRAEQAQKDLTAAFANKQAADATPVAQTAAEILASPDGKRPVVQNAVKSVLDQMTDAKGNLETDPEMLYGVRKHIDDLMSKEAARDNPASVRASAQLQQLKGVLDQTIEQAAPGFRQYLDNFAQASRPIDEMRVLQEYRPKLFNANNQMTYSGVQRMMKDLVTARSNTRGVDATHSISDETMQRLWNLRDDLRRVASADDLARAKGSDTAQNAMDIAKSFAKQGVMHGAANYMAPGVGSLVVNMVNNKLRQAAVSKAADRALNPAINRLAPPQMRD